MRKDIECDTQNSVTFEWDPAMNINEAQLSHYEVVVTQNTSDVVKAINITNTSLVFNLEDGTYTASVTAVNKCGERSDTITSVNVIKNEGTACKPQDQTPYQLTIPFSVISGFTIITQIVLLLCSGIIIILLYIVWRKLVNEIHAHQHST